MGFGVLFLVEMQIHLLRKKWQERGKNKPEQQSKQKYALSIWVLWMLYSLYILAYAKLLNKCFEVPYNSLAPSAIQFLL